AAPRTPLPDRAWLQRVPASLPIYGTSSWRSPPRARIRFTLTMPDRIRYVVLGTCIAYAVWCWCGLLFPDRPFAPDSEALFRGTWPLLCDALAIVSFSACLFFMRPRRRLVLFLRRFQNPMATALLAESVRRRHGAAIRLVTLDD